MTAYMRIRGLEKILNQKAATPHVVSNDPATALDDHRPNIITFQKCGCDEKDDGRISWHELIFISKHHITVVTLMPTELEYLWLCRRHFHFGQRD